MKRFLGWLGITLAVAVVAQAQINPVRLKVNKTEKKDRKTTYRSTDGYTQQQQIQSTVFYTIEVANVSATPVTDLQVKWALLIKTRVVPEFKVVEGERTCSIGLGQKYVFDTDIVELSGSQWQNNWTGSRSGSSAEVAGYAVEVLSGDRIVASEIIPADTKRRIEQLKKPPASEKQPQDPNRHKF
jgi:hypothetical protein